MEHAFDCRGMSRKYLRYNGDNLPYGRDDMPNGDIDLLAHLMRRAGFGASRDELEALSRKEYESVVDDLVHPERFPDIDEDIVDRYDRSHGSIDRNIWMYRMINTGRPLNEKMTLFWHHLLATGSSKSNSPHPSEIQIVMFRRYALSNVSTLLREVSKDPAMIFWLDNNENNKEQPNENYGRELLELFSMGVGNYTEDDVKECARAFTGWSFQQPVPGTSPYGKYASHFVYRAEDHDEEEKSFLGEVGRLNGEDIIDVIVKQPAVARFISRHLYTFFVSDEPAVASWNEVPPQDPDAIDTLAQAYLESNGDLRCILSVLFNSDFFKDARFRRVKSPTELVTGVLKLTGTNKSLHPKVKNYFSVATGMGQTLYNPLTVEGWRTGPEWIDGGTLNERVNFAVNEVGDASQPGIQAIVERMAANGGSLRPQEFVERCLDLAGPVAVDNDTRNGLVAHAEPEGDVTFGTNEKRLESAARVAKMLQLIVATREYQFN